MKPLIRPEFYDVHWTKKKRSLYLPTIALKLFKLHGCQLYTQRKHLFLFLWLLNQLPTHEDFQNGSFLPSSISRHVFQKLWVTKATCVLVWLALFESHQNSASAGFYLFGYESGNSTLRVTRSIIQVSIYNSGSDLLLNMIRFLIETSWKLVEPILISSFYVPASFSILCLNSILITPKLGGKKESLLPWFTYTTLKY